MLSANISLHKINNPEFRLFLETNMNGDIPNERTLRKNYVNYVYPILKKYKRKCKGKKFWVSTDETKDVLFKYCKTTN